MLKPRLVERFERCYDAILAEGFAFHETQPPLAPATTTASRKHCGRTPRRTGHNLLLRLSTRKQDTLRFLHDPAVPFTNNQAERDGRMMKVKQKISGGFRCGASAADFAVIRSFISTAKKQGWDHPGPDPRPQMQARLPADWVTYQFAPGQLPCGMSYPMAF